MSAELHASRAAGAVGGQPTPHWPAAMHSVMSESRSVARLAQTVVGVVARLWQTWLPSLALQQRQPLLVQLRLKLALSSTTAESKQVVVAVTVAVLKLHAPAMSVVGSWHSALVST
jgi:hypothetical protein